MKRQKEKRKGIEKEKEKEIGKGKGKENMKKFLEDINIEKTKILIDIP